MSVKDFVPPVLIRFSRRVTGLSGNREYSSYYDAERQCTADAYQNTELCSMIAVKTVIHSKNLVKRPFEINATNIFLASAVLQHLQRHSAKSINILDIGGACGAHYFETRRLIPETVSLNWFVVETDQMVRSALANKLDNDELHFLESLGEFKGNAEFIHSSCTLHYVPDPYGLTDQILSKKPSTLLFNRMMFNQNNRDLITVQKSFLSDNGPGPLPDGFKNKIISYPHITLSYEKFNSMVKNSGYYPECVFEDLSGSHPIGNEKIIGRGLLYLKN